MQHRLITIILCLVAPAGGLAAEGRAVLWETNLVEHIGQPWAGELLHYRIATAAPLPPECRLVITDEAGRVREVAVQIAAATGEPAAGGHAYDLHCVTDLAPYGKRVIQLLKGAPAADLAASLPVATDGKVITASSLALAIQVPDAIPDGRALATAAIPPPLIRLRNARQEGWGGAGVFTNVGELLELRTTVTTNGPVFTDMELEYRFAHGRYRAGLRLIRDQPLVLWRDETRHDNPAALLTWDFSPGFAPQSVFPFPGKDSQGRPAQVSMPAGTALKSGVSVHPGNPWLELWPQAAETAGADLDKPPPTAEADKVFELLREAVEPEGDPTAGAAGPPRWVIGFFAGFPRDWRIVESEHPKVPFWYSLPALTARGTNVVAELPLFDGRRSFGISVADTGGGTAARSIRYGQTPLDEVKDYVLDYDRDLPDSFPRRLFDETGRRACAAALDTNAFFHAEVEKARDACARALAGKDFKPVFAQLCTADLTAGNIRGPWSDRDLVVAALYSRDETLAPLLQAGAMASARRFASHFFEPVPSDRTWVSTWFSGELGISVVDSGSRFLEPEAFRRGRARMLFLACKLASGMFEYSRTGRGAPLNMCRTHVNGFLGSIALLYPNHPQAREWVATAKREMLYELTECSGPNGGWVEAPHYMTVSLDYLFAFALALARAGDEELLYHERLKQTVRWLARISTPRDPRYGNRRHFPEIGNTYRNEGTVLFPLMAGAWRARDPAYADELQWLWYEMGRPLWFHVGGVVPLTDGYREALIDPSPCPPAAPAWGSEWFVDSGVVLRSHLGTGRENYLHLIQGNMHEHYDKDNGSIIVWGKGRPLCEDWGYNCGPGGPVSEHSRMDIGGEGRVTEFATVPGADYVHSRQGPWDRQILFVKDADPQGPSYYLLRDSTAVAGTNTWSAGVTAFRRWPTSPYTAGTGTNAWRLWINVATDSFVRVDGRLVTAVGRDDVDLDIWFDDTSLQRLRRVRQPVAAKTTAPAIAEVELALSEAAPVAGELERVVAAAQAKADETGRPWVYDTPRKTVWVMTGDNRGYWGSTGLEQRELCVPVPEGKDVVALLYPRLRGEPKPAVQASAADQALKIVSPAGTDYVFLSLAATEAQVDDVRFRGTAGVCQRRAGAAVLALGAAGELMAGDYGLGSDWPASLRAGKDILEIELAGKFPGGSLVVTAPGGYAVDPPCDGVALDMREAGRYVLTVPAGCARVTLRR